MCIAVPCQIVAIHDSTAIVEVGGVRKEAWLDLLTEAKVGDYVIVHAGYAIQKVDAENAEQTLRLLREMLEREGDNQ
ncbi:MAG: HypC/HybG/HupF family hydrogenase formation chaperone [bacterium]|nr:HypC/HybG/HupF family hydrogenase formation chaperone [bacterium]